MHKGLPWLSKADVAKLVGEMREKASVDHADDRRLIVGITIEKLSNGKFHLMTASASSAPSAE